MKPRVPSRRLAVNARTTLIRIPCFHSERFITGRDERYYLHLSADLPATGNTANYNDHFSLLRIMIVGMNGTNPNSIPITVHKEITEYIFAAIPCLKSG